MSDRDLTEGRRLLRTVNPEHLEAFVNESPNALARRMHTSLRVALLLRWAAANMAELLEVTDHA